MDPQIIEKGEIVLVGMVYYGPMGGEVWSEKNQIGQLWERFNKFCEAKWGAIADSVVRPKFGHELNIWNREEFEKTRCFYVFVGVEVQQIAELPLELVVKKLPPGMYAHFTAKGGDITAWEDPFYNQWLPESGYQLAEYQGYSFQIQSYEEGRFKGVGDLLAESEVDIYVPVRKKM